MIARAVNSHSTPDQATAPARAALFAVPSLRADNPSLRAAGRAAAALGLDLHVLRVLPSMNRVNPLFPQATIASTFSAMAASERMMRATRSWVLDVLEDDRVADRVVVVRGSFGDEVIRRAADVGASLVVLPASVSKLGRAATEIACATQVPVLVPRKMGTKDTIVAATSLSVDGNPVLHRAAQLGETLRAPVVAVHNLAPLPFDTGSWGAYLDRTITFAEGMSRRLHDAVGRLSTRATGVVTTATDPTEGILAAAREQEADLVVVGARRRSWIERTLSHDVAASVVNTAKRSVLVEPIA